MDSDSTIEKILRELLDALGVTYSGIVKSEIAGQNIFSIQAEDGRTLIGSRGDTIQAIDSLVKKIAEKRLYAVVSDESGAAEGGEQRSALHFLIDVNDYRAKQILDIKNKAIMMAERAKSFQYDVELSPMSSYERLIVHTALSDMPNIKTESQGEGRGRRVVIRYTA